MIRWVQTKWAQATHRPVILKPFVSPLALWQRLLGLVFLGGLGVLCFVGGFYYALTTPYLIMGFVAPLGILSLIIVWALPEMHRAPLGVMEKFFFAFFLCLFLWPNYLAIALKGLPWVTLLRLTGLPMAFLLLICVSVSRDFRRDVSRVLSATPGIWRLLAAFVTIQLLTIILSQQPSTSLQKFIVAQTNWTAVFVVGCYIFRKPGNIERYIFALWIIAIIICAIGVAEDINKQVLWVGHIPSFLKIDSDINLFSTSIRAGGRYRVKATFTTPLGLAEFLALTMPFIIHYIFTARKLLVRLAALASFALMYQVILTTDSRLGLVGTIVALLFYLMVWGVMRWRNGDGSILGTAIVFSYPVFATAFLGLTFASHRVHDMVWGGAAQQGSNLARQAQVDRGLPMIWRNPFGHGPGQAAETLGFHVGSFQTIDNYYLAIALEYGVIGFLLYYGLIGLAIWHAGKTTIDFADKPQRESDFLIPLGTSLVVFFVVKSVFSQQDNHPLIFIFMSMIVALVYRMRGGATAGASLSQARGTNGKL